MTPLHQSHNKKRLRDVEADDAEAALAAFEERAAIRVHDGGEAHSDALRAAAAEVLIDWLRTHVATGDHLGRCWQCSSPIDASALRLRGRMRVHAYCHVISLVTRIDEGHAWMTAAGIPKAALSSLGGPQNPRDVMLDAAIADFRRRHDGRRPSISDRDARQLWRL